MVEAERVILGSNAKWTRHIFVRCRPLHCSLLAGRLLPVVIVLCALKVPGAPAQ